METTEKPKKELTPEQKEALEKKRAKFVELYNVVAEGTIDDTRESIDLLTEEMFASTAREQNERKMSSFHMNPIEIDGKQNDVSEKLKSLVADLSFSEAQEMLGALNNAITFHASRKMKDVPVKDLGIKIS